MVPQLWSFITRSHFISYLRFPGALTETGNAWSCSVIPKNHFWA